MQRSFFTRFVHWIGYDLGISPNQITLGRLLFFIPGWFTWVYMREIGAWSGIWWQLVGLFAFLLVTTVILFDIVDGELARETGQVSQEGKTLDPLVDKFITYSTLSLFWAVINHVALIALFVLDITSTWLRGKDAQGANEFGKKKALAQNFSKIFFGAAVLTGYAKLNVIGNLLIWAALVLASISVSMRLLPARAKTPLLVLIPQLLTGSNMVCGLLAIWSATEGEVQHGVLLIMGAMGFDLLDGAVARRLGVESSFGKYFDTAADLVSFGLAPAALVAATTEWADYSIATGCIYAIATGVRLWDYGRSKHKTPSGFFRGMPSPASAWLVAAGVVTLPPVAAVLLSLAAAALMCSFFINWQHFSRMIPTLTIPELFVSMVLGIIAGVTVSPLSFLAGPICVYLFSPQWRKPGKTPKPSAEGPAN